jgi:hypothetical protein
VRGLLIRLGAGIPVFLVLEAATTGCQLVHSMAQASAILAGQPDPLTVWERWSRFLEAGGRFALEVGAALITVTAVRMPPACRARRATPGDLQRRNHPGSVKDKAWAKCYAGVARYWLSAGWHGGSPHHSSGRP